MLPLQYRSSKATRFRDSETEPEFFSNSSR
jgi:hypothetical protein